MTQSAQAMVILLFAWVSLSWPAAVQACPRYEERFNSECVPVVVTGVMSEALSFERDGYTLEGTLVRPITRGEYVAPGVVLVHGSGPNDRDESQLGSLGVSYGQLIPMFRQLAEGLAQRGVAVYRYDKRTCFRENSHTNSLCTHSIQEYPGYPESLDRIFESDYVLDARAALHQLARQPWVDPQDLTIIGHSEGANFVPLIMMDEPGVVAGVQLAGPSESIDRLIVGQLRDLANYLEQVDPVFYAEQILSLRLTANTYEDVFDRIRMGTYVESRFLGATVEQWREWMTHTDNLRAEFQAVTKPIFLLNGDFDFNVAPRHLQQFQQWAIEAGMSNADFLLLDNVTHAFVTLVPEGIDPRFSSPALAAISKWHRSLDVER